MSRPLLLDLFCGAGGAAVGYHRAGFDVIGVDIEPQPHYPFRFVQADALEFDSTGFDAIHASPPCQSNVALSVNRWGKDSARWPDLIAPIRTRLHEAGVPFVIENVLGAPLIDPLTLTGSMFGLGVHRPRLFELGGWWTLSAPKARRHDTPVAVYGKPDGRRLITRSDGSEYRAWSSIEEGQEALGIDWTDDWNQLREAIPPAYTEWIGTQLLDNLNHRSLPCVSQSKESK